MNRKVVVFLALLYGYLVLLYLLYLSVGIPLFPTLLAASWGPNLSAVALLALVYRQKGGIRALLRRWIRVRIPVLSYALAAGYLLVVAAAVGLYAAGGSLFIASVAHFLLNFALAFVPQLGIDPGAFFYYYAAMNILYALLVVITAGTQLGKRSADAQGGRPTPAGGRNGQCAP